MPNYPEFIHFWVEFTHHIGIVAAPGACYLDEVEVPEDILELKGDVD